LPLTASDCLLLVQRLQILKEAEPGAD